MLKQSVLVPAILGIFCHDGSSRGSSERQFCDASEARTTVVNDAGTEPTQHIVSAPNETERGEIGSDFCSGIRQLASDPKRGFVTIEFDTQAAPEEINAVSSILDASKP